MEKKTSTQRNLKKHTKHTKHAQLAKPLSGEFASNEWSFLGAPCSVIKDLVRQISEIAESTILYIDESHDHEAQVDNLSVATKKGEEQSLQIGLPWGKNQNALSFGAYDFVLVNGNHFKADKQFVILDPRRKNH